VDPTGLDDVAINDLQDLLLVAMIPTKPTETPETTLIVGGAEDERNCQYLQT
jgi:hypothetical protein